MSPPVYRGDILFLCRISVCLSVRPSVRPCPSVCLSVHEIVSAPYLRNGLRDFHLNLCHMFTSRRRRAEPMCRPYRFKVKVRLEGHRFEPVFRVRSISPKRLEGFSLNLCHMFTSRRRRAEPMCRPYRFKVKVRLEGHRFEPVFRVRSISPKRLEGFSLNLCHMFTSRRRHAEPMCRPYRFKVKVRLEGHRFEPVFRVRSISPKRLRGIFIKLVSHVHPKEAMCRIRVLTIPVQGQGHA